MPDALLAESPSDLIGDCWAGDCAPSNGGLCSGWTYWGSFEFLLWWRQSQGLPPLITTSLPDTPSEVAGVLGQSTTQVLYPTEEQGGDARPGARLTLGVWFDPCQISGLGARLYTLGEMTASYDVVSSDTMPILARPFFDVKTDAQSSFLVAYPNQIAGGISVRSDSEVSGGDIFLRRLLFVLDNTRRIDLLAGYQFASIDSRVAIGTGQVVINKPPFQSGTSIDAYDSFAATNRFHAGEIGLLGNVDRGPMTWSLLAKVGLGKMKQRTTITGHQEIRTPAETPVVRDQGLLALGTNIGVYEQNKFTVSPEIQFTAAYHLNDYVDLTCGYSFIYWNHVTQAGLQIDDVINQTQITGSLDGSPRPAFPNQGSDFFVHGIHMGVQVVW